MPLNTVSASLKISPSGRCALLYSLAAPPPCQSRQSSPERTGVISPPRVGIDANGEVHFKPGKGGLGNKAELSWKSARVLKETMAAQEREYGKQKCWFVTLTLPSMDTQSYEALARYSAYAMDRLNKAITRWFGSDKFCRSNVWEYQKRGALHVHLLISSPVICGAKIASFRRHLSRFWYSILSDIGSKFNADMFLGRNGKTRNLKQLMSINNGKHFINCQQVRKSVVAYLCSYLGKSGTGKDKKGKQALRKRYFPVATWAQWDREATRLREKYTLEFDLGEAKNIDIVSIESAMLSLEESLPCVDGTEVKRPKNPFIKGVYFIASMQCKRDVCKLLDIVRTELQWLFDDSNKYQEWLRNNRQHEYDIDPCENEVGLPLDDELELRLHSLETRISQRREARELGDYVALLGMFMLEFVEEKASELEDNPITVYEQLTLEL